MVWWKKKTPFLFIPLIAKASERQKKAPQSILQGCELPLGKCAFATKSPMRTRNMFTEPVVYPTKAHGQSWHEVSRHRGKSVRT